MAQWDGRTCTMQCSVHLSCGVEQAPYSAPPCTVRRTPAVQAYNVRRTPYGATGVGWDGAGVTVAQSALPCGCAPQRWRAPTQRRHESCVRPRNSCAHGGAHAHTFTASRHEREDGSAAHGRVMEYVLLSPPAAEARPCPWFWEALGGGGRWWGVVGVPAERAVRRVCHAESAALGDGRIVAAPQRRVVPLDAANKQRTHSNLSTRNGRR